MSDDSTDIPALTDYYSLLYARPVVCGIGFFLNLICILVFAKKSVHREAKGHMFKYFLLKAVFDTLTLGLISLSPIYYYYYFKEMDEATYLSAIYQKYFMVYLATVCSMAATIFEVLATVDRFFTVKENLLTKYYEKISYKLVTMASVIFSFGLYVFYLVHVRIKKIEYEYQEDEESSVAAFYLTYNGIPDENVSYTLYLMTTILRDVVSVVLLIIINVLLCVQLKSQMQIKKRLAHANKHLEAKAAKCEIKNTVMVLVLSFCSILMHLPYILFYMSFVRDSAEVRSYLSDYQGIMFCFFQSISLFGYLFNKKFKKGLQDLFCISPKSLGSGSKAHLPHLNLHLHSRKHKTHGDKMAAYEYDCRNRSSISTIDGQSCNTSQTELSLVLK